MVDSSFLSPFGNDRCTQVLTRQRSVLLHSCVHGDVCCVADLELLEVIRALFSGKGDVCNALGKVAKLFRQQIDDLRGQFRSRACLRC